MITIIVGVLLGLIVLILLGQVIFSIICSIFWPIVTLVINVYIIMLKIFMALWFLFFAAGAYFAYRYFFP